ncbi:MAG TPA: hypothetical protein DCQ31_02005 [Bacteroidales bacterium]|nr:hypothetical protein [Bacteroidales bacterium]
MEITIIIGFSPETPAEIEVFCAKFEKIVIASGHQTVVFNLAKMHIKPCSGCWSCWVKTPGLCGTHDDAELILKRYLHSDLVLFFTNLPAGFISSSTKKIIDKLIPHYHPYIFIKEGEMDHLPRYDRYPDLASIFIQPENADELDLQISDDYMRRVASQFHSNYKFTCINPKTAEEVYHEITNS